MNWSGTSQKTTATRVKMAEKKNGRDIDKKIEKFESVIKKKEALYVKIMDRFPFHIPFKNLSSVQNVSCLSVLHVSQVSFRETVNATFFHVLTVKFEMTIGFPHFRIITVCCCLFSKSIVTYHKRVSLQLFNLLCLFIVKWWN